MSSTADFIVIGAGIAGATVADALAERGRVVVLETEDRAGYHTTGRSAATFIQNYGPPMVRCLTRASRAFYEAPPAGFTAAPLLSERGVLYLAGPEDLDALAAELANADGLERLEPAQLAAIVPVVAHGPTVAGAFERDARDIDVDALHGAALKRLRARGGEVLLGARVTAMARRGGHWHVTAGERRLQAPVVVNAAGAWGDEVAGLAGAAPVGLTPLRRTIAVVEVSGPVPVDRSWPLLAGVAGDWYCKPQGQWLMVSPADETPSAPCDAYPEDLDIAIGVDRMQRATGYEVRRLQHSWAGLRTFAPDRELVAGFDPECDGFFWLVGQGGYGIQTAPAMAELAAALACGEALPGALARCGVAAERLAPGRFRG